ncbi:MAG: porin family protein [Flavobacteriaceae bacterium]|nr:porin family protein [Flavobacteriaceae bacterium]
MKKIVLTTVIAVLTATTMVNAQDVRYGVRGGLNFAKMKVEEDDDGVKTTKRRTDFYLGVFLERKITPTNDKLYGEIGLDYSSQGGSVINKFDIDSFEYREERKRYEKVKLVANLINLNASLKYEVYKNAFIKGGVYLGYLLSYNIERDGSSEELKVDGAIFDYGIPLGVEYNLDNGMFFNLNYNIGLGIFSLEDNPVFDVVSIKNRVLQLGLGYKF